MRSALLYYQSEISYQQWYNSQNIFYDDDVCKISTERKYQVSYQYPISIGRYLLAHLPHHSCSEVGSSVVLHAALELQELHICIPPAESMPVRVDSVGMVHSEKWVGLRGRGTLPFQ